VKRVVLASFLGTALGSSEVEIDASTVRGALAELSKRFGKAFDDRLPACRLLLDGSNVAFLQRGLSTELHEGAELVVLPPMAGG
jgi:molybdopterin converting factor small subunit